MGMRSHLWRVIVSCLVSGVVACQGSITDDGTGLDEGAGKGGHRRYSLGVSKSGTGSGTITSSPYGIDCGGTCQASFLYGTVVTLTVAAAAGSQFAGWSGACSGTGS